jgi:hypothetical protein
MTIYPIPITEAYTFTAEKSVTVTGEETLLLSADEKEQLLLAWQRLLLSGFKNLFFTGPLYRFLVHHCHFSAHRNREQFWNFYLNGSISRFRSFLAQFGGDRVSAEQGNHLWLNGPATDLKEAMCCEASRLYAPLSQVLQDLEIKHEEMIAAWHDFAVAANITAATLPPAYQVSENTRHLLAYAATIALRRQRPLTGLQLMFPPQPQPLLLPLPVEGQKVVIINGQGGGQ